MRNLVLNMVAQSVKNLRAVQEISCNAGDLGWIPGSGRSAGEGNGKSFQYSCLRNPMDREAWSENLWGPKESDKTEQLYHHQQSIK